MQYSQGKIVFWIIPILLVVGGIYWLLSTNERVGNWFKPKTVSTETETIEGGTPEPIINTEREEETDETEIPEEKESSEKPDENLRQSIIKHINSKLGDLAAPPKDDKWDTPSYYFVGNSKVYLELYALDTDLEGIKILYDVDKAGNDFTLKELARYSEGEDDWILKGGEDEYEEYAMDIYDYDEDDKRWEKNIDWEWEEVDDEEDWEDEEDEDEEEEEE